MMTLPINSFNILIFIYIFIVGLCIGSFLNVVILRGLADESIVFPPSKCPKCLNKLKWYHNIPILSYVFLRGKCAFCHEKISIQYPIIEFLNGLIYGALFLKYGLCLNLLFYFIFASLFIVIFMTDIKEKVIFTSHAYILTFFGLLFNFLNKNLVDSVLGSLVGFIFLEIITFFIYKIIKKRAFGEGDSYVLMGLGAIFGLKSLLNIIILSFLVQVVSVLPQFLKGLLEKKEYCLILMLSIFAVAAILSNFYLNNMINIAVLFLSGILSCYKLLKITKLNNDIKQFPFAPSLILGGLIYYFTTIFFLG
ncbi:MAG: prepilin peptidase [Candidatus Gastranaerophilales bacterium]|nr:prepilin peptidase [Candidatus Gastranaerophilales bacterium]